ncbi:MAG: acyltransferase family protein [Prevotella sp.]|nr:acyltransferase family protein [Prevotella sp.]
MKERDIQLDCYRALIMMYIICVVHMVHWLGVGKEPVKSIVYFSMPIMFFISGAAISVSKSKKTILATVVNRAKRALVPFYVYALFSLIVLTYLTLVAVNDCNIFSYNLNDVIRVLVAHDIPQMTNNMPQGNPIYGKTLPHLWFIIVFLILSVTVPIQQKIIEKFHLSDHWYFALCILAFAIVQFLPRIFSLQEVFGYNLFLVAGMLYYKKLSKGKIALCGGVSLVVLVLCMVVGGMNFFPMVKNHYPPNTLYVAYTMFILSLLALFFSVVKVKNTWLVDFWNKKGYSLYLYQNFAFFIVAPLKTYIAAHCQSAIITGILCFLLLLAVSTILVMMITPLEEPLTNMIYKIPFLNIDKRSKN